MATEIYISTDIEADGPIPGPHSMLSFASAAFLADKTMLGTFAANLDSLPDATIHPDTQRFWDANPQAWLATRQQPQSPLQAMREYSHWLNTLPGKPVFAGYPAAFDFMFMYWYLIRFTGSSPFSHSALDIKTLAMSLMRSEYRAASKRRMPKQWFSATRKHTHVALDDAIEQGELLCNMLEKLHQN